MADSTVAGMPGEQNAAAAQHACRDGRRVSVASLDLLVQMAEAGSPGRQAAIAARAIAADVDGELERVAATRLGAG